MTKPEMTDDQRGMIELFAVIVHIVESDISDEEKVKCFKGIADGIKDSMKRKD